MTQAYFRGSTTQTQGTLRSASKIALIEVKDSWSKGKPTESCLILARSVRFLIRPDEATRNSDWALEIIVCSMQVSRITELNSSLNHRSSYDNSASQE